jgi:2,3-bisphosphoglycerate-independent phosphoglycerate mutase
MKERTPTLLLILDGWGAAPEGPGNAVSSAATPNMDALLRDYPGTTLECTGEAVGLPAGQMGNSEVGHLNIGAGRVVNQDIVRIDKAVRDGSFFRNETLNRVMDRVLENGGRLHLMGLVSDGGVHSHQSHLEALLRLAGRKGLSRVAVHAFLDGRDTPPSSGLEYVRRLQQSMREGNIGEIATVSGRYYAMDRDQRWERTRLAYEGVVCGSGRRSRDAAQAVQEAYDLGETDEFVVPTVIEDDKGGPRAPVEDGDAVFLFNFRADRARQLVKSISDAQFSQFERRRVPSLSELATMTQYDRTFDLQVAFPPQHLSNILGEVCSARNMQQLRIAETEKYAHVTYFFNGGREEPYRGEDRVLIPSPQEVPTYDQKPEMSVYEVAEKLVLQWENGAYDLVVCNFANLDMVGHTGNFEATVRACEAVDECVGRVVSRVRSSGGRIMLTADHGNADVMLDVGGGRQTAHSQSPVPFILIDPERRLTLRNGGVLGDVAPTILELWGIEQPEEMTGKSLIAP